MYKHWWSTIPNRTTISHLKVLTVELNTNNENRNHHLIKEEEMFNNSKTNTKTKRQNLNCKPYTVMHVNKQLNYHDNKDGAYCRNIA